MYSSDKLHHGTVLVLATGGTIAGVGETGKITEYQAGQITAGQLIATVPGIEKAADIAHEQICNINSDDITGEIWIRLACIINERAKDPDISGFVITHGTDTMDETAFFLNLTVKTDKPVIMTGSMRPSTAISADGPMNLYQAVSVANNKRSVGRGVMAVFSNQIFSARYFSKTSTHLLTAMSGGEAGAVGNVSDNTVRYNYVLEKPHTVNTEFDVESIKVLPKVSVIYFNADADEKLLRFAADNNDGIVIAGAGMGGYSKRFKEIIGNISIPVVISSRTVSGIIEKNSLQNKTAICANDLSPQKAAILLQLGLTVTRDLSRLQQMFFKY